MSEQPLPESAPHTTQDQALHVDPTATVSPDARIYPSIRGTKISIGAHTAIHEFVVIKAVGGTGDIRIGSHCQLNPGTVLYSGSGITIGNDVLIAPGCVISPANHEYRDPLTPIRMQRFMPSKGGVVIEDDVWIGAHCTLLDGTHIGKGSIIAAGSVVNGKVEGYSIYAGAPAKKIRERK